MSANSDRDRDRDRHHEPSRARSRSRSPRRARSDSRSSTLDGRRRRSRSPRARQSHDRHDQELRYHSAARRVGSRMQQCTWSNHPHLSSSRFKFHVSNVVDLVCSIFVSLLPQEHNLRPASRPVSVLAGAVAKASLTTTIYTLTLLVKRNFCWHARAVGRRSAWRSMTARSEQLLSRHRLAHQPTRVRLPLNTLVTRQRSGFHRKRLPSTTSLLRTTAVVSSFPVDTTTHLVTARSLSVPARAKDQQQVHRELTHW